MYINQSNTLLRHRIGLFLLLIIGGLLASPLTNQQHPAPVHALEFNLTILEIPQLHTGARISNVAYSTVNNGTLFFTTGVWSSGSGVFSYHLDSSNLTQLLGNSSRAGNNEDCGLDPSFSDFAEHHQAPGTLDSALEVIAEGEILLSSRAPSVHIYQMSAGHVSHPFSPMTGSKTRLLPLITNGPGCRFNVSDPVFLPGTPTWTPQIGNVKNTLLLEGGGKGSSGSSAAVDPLLLFTQYDFIGAVQKNLFQEWLGKQYQPLEYNDTSVGEYVERASSLTKFPKQMARFVNSSGEEHVLFGDSSGLVRSVHLDTDMVFPLVGTLNSSWPPKTCSLAQPCGLDEVYFFGVSGLVAFNATSLFIADGSLGVIYFANLATGQVRVIAGKLLMPYTKGGPPGVSRVSTVRSLSLSSTHLYFTSGSHIGALELPANVRLQKLPSKVCSVQQHCSGNAYWVEGNPTTSCNCTCYRGFTGDECENKVGPFTATKLPTASLVPTSSRGVPTDSRQKEITATTHYTVSRTVVEEPILCETFVPSPPTQSQSVEEFQESGASVMLNFTGIELVDGLVEPQLYQVVTVAGPEKKSVALNATIQQFEANSSMYVILPPPPEGLEAPATIQIFLTPQWFRASIDGGAVESECLEVNSTQLIFTLEIVVPEPESSKVAQAAAEVVVPAVTAVGTIASTAGAVDIQSLVVIGLMSCAQPGQKKIAENNQRALSPIAFSNTHAGILFGNVALVFIVALIHVFITALWKQWKGKSFQQATIDLGFPNYSLRALFFVFQGTAIAGLNLLRPRDDGSTLAHDIVFGVFGVLCSISIPVFFVLYTRKVVSARFGVYDPIIMNQRYSPILVKYILPWGQWTPRDARKKYGALFSSIASNKRIWSCASLISPTILVIGTVIRPSTPSGCVAQYSVLAALEILWGIFIIAVQPLRSHAMTLCWGLSIIFLGIVLAGTGAAANDPTGPGASVAFAATLCQLFFSILRTAISIALTLFERRKLSSIGTKTVFIWRVAGEDADLVDGERAEADNAATPGDDPFGLSAEMLTERNIGGDCENEGAGTPHPDQRVANASLAAVPTHSAMTTSFANNNSVLSKLSHSPEMGAQPAPAPPAPAPAPSVSPPVRREAAAVEKKEEEDLIDDDLAAFL